MRTGVEASTAPAWSEDKPGQGETFSASTIGRNIWGCDRCVELVKVLTSLCVQYGPKNDMVLLTRFQMIIVGYIRITTTKRQMKITLNEKRGPFEPCAQRRIKKARTKNPPSSWMKRIVKDERNSPTQTHTHTHTHTDGSISLLTSGKKQWVWEKKSLPLISRTSGRVDEKNGGFANSSSPLTPRLRATKGSERWQVKANLGP